MVSRCWVATGGGGRGADARPLAQALARCVDRRPPGAASGRLRAGAAAQRTGPFAHAIAAGSAVPACFVASHADCGRALPFQPERAALPIPLGNRGRRRNPGANLGAAHLGGGCVAVWGRGEWRLKRCAINGWAALRMLRAEIVGRPTHGRRGPWHANREVRTRVGCWRASPQRSGTIGGGG